MPASQRPYFMQVVQPYVSQEWSTLLKVALEWVQNEPNTAESWFYLAAAEYATKDYSNAEEHLKKVLALNNKHIQSIEYLVRISQIKASVDDALSQLAQLD
jgi:tetratricopeptide (TPR) repeat protein